MRRFIVLLIVLGSVFGATWFSEGNIGISSECVNGHCLVRGSTSIAAIIIGIFLAIFAITLPRGNRKDIEIRAGFWRRFASFILDFMSIMFALTPVLALPAVFMEYIHTGTFNWMFQRDYSRPSDYLVILPCVLLLFAALFYYFYYYTLNSKPTLGQYILGYRVVSTEGDMTPSIARKRVFLSMLGASWWPISVVHGLIKKRVFWWDSSSNSIAVLTIEVN